MKKTYGELLAPWCVASLIVAMAAMMATPVFLFLSVGCCDGPRDLTESVFFYPAKPLAAILEAAGMNNYLAALVANGPSCGLAVLLPGMVIAALRKASQPGP